MHSAPLSAIRHLVVLANPSPASFNRSIADAYCAATRACGQEAVLRDLYAMSFDPLLKDAERPDRPGFAPAPDVAGELALVRDCAVVTLVHPIWFGMPPAMLKGYVDRVLGAGFVAAQIKRGEPHPLLRGKRMMIFTTSSSTRPWLDEMGQWEALRQAFDNYLGTIFAMEQSGHRQVSWETISGGILGLLRCSRLRGYHFQLSRWVCRRAHRRGQWSLVSIWTHSSTRLQLTSLQSPRLMQTQ